MNFFCPKCTFKNAPTATQCAMCGTPNTGNDQQVEWHCSICNHPNPDSFTNCSQCTALRYQRQVVQTPPPQTPDFGNDELPTYAQDPEVSEKAQTQTGNQSQEPAQSQQESQEPAQSQQGQEDTAMDVDSNQMDISENNDNDMDADSWGDDDDEDDGLTMKIVKGVMHQMLHISGAEKESIEATLEATYGRRAYEIPEVKFSFESNSVLFDEDCFLGYWKSLEGQADKDDEEELAGQSEADSWGDDEDWGSDNDMEVQDGMMDTTDHEKVVTEQLANKQIDAYQVLNMDQLFNFRQKVIEDWAGFLGMDDIQQVIILCQNFGWNQSKCLMALSENGDEVRQDYGLDLVDPSQKNTEPLVTSGQFMCNLCYCEEDAANSAAIPECGHQFCGDCWGQWLNAEVESKGPSCIYTKCIMGCGLQVYSSFYDRFLSEQLKKIYRKHLATNFLQGSRVVKQCPGTDCTKLILYEGGGQQDVECTCGHKWCFNCGLPNHAPCTCHHASKWTEMASSDAENITWIRANTKKCPNCNTSIEKNQGCMHMRCLNCRHEFCWMCGMTWFNHRAATHSGCNKSDQILKQEKSQQKSQSKLARYMFYYSRFEAHQKALEFAAKSQKVAENRMNQMLDIRSDWNMQQVMYVKEAVDEVVRCRRILQWTYCFGFYLADGPNKNLFEDHQGRLEVFADRLHEFTERDIMSLLELSVREEMINLTKTVKKFRHGVTDYTSTMIFDEYKEEVVDDPDLNKIGVDGKVVKRNFGGLF